VREVDIKWLWMQARLLRGEQLILVARSASNHGYAVAFITVSVLAVIGLVLVAQLVRKAIEPTEPLQGQDAVAQAEPRTSAAGTRE
jgi:hypothetical protein